jgi:ADP-heptose:LPS heptosyltransferase
MLKKIIRHALSYNEIRYVNRVLSNKTKRAADLRGARHFLCLQMNAIGDTIMTQPAWAAIRGSFPDAIIDLVCSPHVAPLFEKDPAIRRIHRLKKRRYRPWLFGDSEGVRQELIKGRYDLIIDFTALPLTAALCSRNDMPLSIGFQRNMKTSAGIMDLGRAYDMTYPYSEDVHLRTLMHRLVSSLSETDNREVAPKIYLDDDSIRKAADLIASLGLKQKSFIIIHPGAKWPPKAWPVEHWQALIRTLQENRKEPVLILGGGSDRKIIDEILLDSRLFDVSHYISTDIELSAALIQLSALCLCHDSAPMHMAAALGVKTVALFGPVLPSRSAPPESITCRVLHHDMFCSPCMLYYSRDRCRRGINFCMHALGPDEVARVVDEMLASH